jgi:hypothetical protein
LGLGFYLAHSREVNTSKLKIGKSLEVHNICRVLDHVMHYSAYILSIDLLPLLQPEPGMTKESASCTYHQSIVNKGVWVSSQIVQTFFLMQY